MEYSTTHRTVSVTYTDSIGVEREFKFTADQRAALYITEEFILRFGTDAHPVAVWIIGGWTGEWSSDQLLTHEFSRFMREKWEVYR